MQIFKNISSCEDNHLIGNSAFRSGMGLIETMRLQEGALPFLAFHFRRLKESAKLLHLYIPLEWPEFKKYMEDFIFENSPLANGSIRLQFFENSVTNVPGCFIEHKPLPDSQKDGITIDLAKDIVMPQDRAANFKTSSRIRYQMAMQQAAQNKWDDALLLNQSGRISESTIANIFWIKNGRMYTPPLSEGCVAGVMRYLLCNCKAIDEQVNEQILEYPTLAAADEIFLTNAVRGIIPVARFEDRNFPVRKASELQEVVVSVLYSKYHELHPDNLNSFF